MGPLSIDHTAVLNSGPIIQGRGVLRATQISAANRPTSKVAVILKKGECKVLGCRWAQGVMICADACLSLE